MSSKYQKQIDKLHNGQYSRQDIVKLKANAERVFHNGESEAQLVLDAINVSVPSDDYVLFMGFSPGGDFRNRQDVEWKEDGICTFDYLESEVQATRFNEVCPGDLVVLKKREKFGETMRLYGHGRVKAIAYKGNGNRYLVMDWSAQNEEIEVPLMGCNSTVDIRDMNDVIREMPDEFFSWLNKSD